MNNHVNNLKKAAVKNTDKSPRGFFTIKQVAAYLSISPREVARCYNRGELPEPRRLGKKCVRWCVDKLRYWQLLDCPRREIFEAQWQVKREKMAMAF